MLNLIKTRLLQVCSIAFTAFLLIGCASSLSAQKNFSEDAKRYIIQSEWEKAYRTLEDALGSTEVAVRLSAYDFIVTHPPVKTAAAETFSQNSLAKTFAAHDPFTAYEIESVRLILYSKIASHAELVAAQENLDAMKEVASQKMANLAAARRSGVDILTVDDGIFGQLTEEDQKRFKLMYPTMQVIPFDSVGIIRTHQVINKSTTGSSAGSQLGSAIAQAAYIDRSFNSYNYSALGQLSAGLLGGILGASLNTAPEARFLINYSVEFRDGSIRGVLKPSSDGIAAPTGQCVFTSDIQEAPMYLCSDSLTAFIDRAKRVGLAGNSGGLSKLSEKVNCKIDVVGTIKLDNEACQKSNGIIIP